MSNVAEMKQDTKAFASPTIPSPDNKLTKPVRETTCGHQPHYAKDLCEKCYRQQPKLREHIKRYMKAYQQLPITKDNRRKYIQRPVYKEHFKAYLKRPEIKKRLQEQKKAYYQRPEIKSRVKDNNLKNYQKIKMLVFKMLGGARCNRCMCDNLNFLEINHINGGGKKEGTVLGENIYQLIASGKRKTDDLEVTCKLCNALHYIELNHPNLIGEYEISWV